MLKGCELKADLNPAQLTGHCLEGGGARLANRRWTVKGSKTNADLAIVTLTREVCGI